MHSSIVVTVTISGIALIVFYTSVGTVCLCHIGDNVDSLVFEQLYVFVVVREWVNRGLMHRDLFTNTPSNSLHRLI